MHEKSKANPQRDQPIGALWLIAAQRPIGV
jgi:hypothetical protein